MQYILLHITLKYIYFTYYFFVIYVSYCIYIVNYLFKFYLYIQLGYLKLLQKFTNEIECNDIFYLNLFTSLEINFTIQNDLISFTILNYL